MTYIPTYAVTFPAPTPPAEAGRCPECDASGLTGVTYVMPTGAQQDKALRVEEFCPTCQGCGAADHDGCLPGVHALDPDEDIGDDTGPHVEVWIGKPDCPSCGGRGWWALTGWHNSDPGAATKLLRVPCGCVESMAVVVDDVELPAALTRAGDDG